MRIVSVVGLVLVGFNLLAQVSNNDIGKRSKLLPNGGPVRSSTANSTVEWQCINKALTNKCLVYHNDQWFNFEVNTPGRYFINVTSQKCRDLKGLQLILIEGNPCEITTYKILECIPQIRQEDVFVELGQLQSGVIYLINVDGFLGDFCEFDIQLSTSPVGLPRTSKNRAFENLQTIEMTTDQHKNIVFIGWTIGREQVKEVEYFSIYRNLKGKTAIHISDVPPQSNAYGSPHVRYLVTDTLPAYGNYAYQIYGVMKADKIPRLINTAQFQYWETKKAEPNEFSINLKIDFEEGTQFKILIYDRDRERELWQFSSGYNAVDYQNYKIFFDPWVKSVKRFTVLVTDGQAPHEYYFRVNQGKIEQE